MSAPWPKDVIARFLTIGGATVDLPQKPMESRAVCSGCGADHIVDWGLSSQSMPRVRKWVQEHAEACRAMPRPGGA